MTSDRRLVQSLEAMAGHGRDTPPVITMEVAWLPDGRQGVDVVATFARDDGPPIRRVWGTYATFARAEAQLGNIGRKPLDWHEIDAANDGILAEMVALARYAPDEYRRRAGFGDG